MTLAISQDAVLKLMSDAGLAQQSAEEGAGDGFLELMDAMTNGGEKENAQDGAQGDEGQKIAGMVSPLTALDAALASASIAGAMQANAQVSVQASVPTNSDVVVKDLASLLVKSASDAQGLVAADDNEGADMSAAGATLETWANGPSAIAAMTSGAQEKKPMQLSVTDVATHFAPVTMADDGDVIAGQPVALTGSDQPKSEAQTQTAIGIAAAGGPNKAQADAQFAGSFADKDHRDQYAEASAEARVDVTGSADVSADFVPDAGTYPSPARQVAQEVVREVPLMKQTERTEQADVKAPLSKLQVLKIQLQPENLGSVNVRIQLRADVIELHIDTSRAETAELLKRDREVLSTIMRAAGYSADDAQIKVTHTDPTMQMSVQAASGDASGSSMSSGGSQQGSAQSNSFNERSAGSQERDGGNRRQGHDHNGSGRDGEHRQAPRTGSGSGIYL